MDKLANRLRDDADRIDASISDELDRRIEASLQAVAPAGSAPPAREARSPWFWLASTLTGVAAALVVIAVINWRAGTQPDSPSATTVAQVPPAAIDLNAEAAMLTRPLEQELEDLQSDLRKAGDKVKRDIGL